MQDKVRCPIMFIDNKVEANDDINDMFYLANDLTVIDSVSNFNIMRDNYDPNQDKDRYEIMSNNHCYTESYDASVRSYIQINVYDLAYTTLLNILADTFGAKAENIGLLIPFNGNTFREEVESASCNVLNFVRLSEDYLKNTNEADIFMRVSMGMDYCMSELVTLFDRSITMNIDQAFKENIMITILPFIYKKMYRTDITDKDRETFNNTPSMAYQFCSSAMREIAKYHIIDLRTALVKVAHNVTEMIYHCPKITDNRYYTNDGQMRLIQNNPLLTDVLSDTSYLIQQK